MPDPAPKFLMASHREKKGFSLDHVAAAVGTTGATLSRVERGVQVPKKDLARALFLFYRRRVPLGAIYDPEMAAR